MAGLCKGGNEPAGSLSHFPGAGTAAARWDALAIPLGPIENSVNYQMIDNNKIYKIVCGDEEEGEKEGRLENAGFVVKDEDGDEEEGGKWEDWRMLEFGYLPLADVKDTGQKSEIHYPSDIISPNRNRKITELMA
ncbi:hypothetical protein ANN_18506 [Periplaneta americana]|uniref:Uncharacterized protein n=1 Tax=Periplaneta americana TaxID=6978 RepID=A0ABQ8SQ64_PERAM|nr:hypothetical protein ANN_18506 [Periplaneta americana]